MDVEGFLRNPTVEALGKATKSDLIKLAQELDLTAVKSTMKKQELRRVIQQHYVGKQVFVAEDLENIPERRLVSGTEQAELEKVRLDHELKVKQLEIEAEREERAREAEREERTKEKEAARAERERTLEREHAFKLKELEIARDRELRLKEIEVEERQKSQELELGKRRAQEEEREEGFDISRALRLVPPFEETDVDSYFLLFEKVARNQKWPRGQWVALLQSVLRGKAQRVYAALSPERDGNYDQVKEAILRGYELVPEAYRQRFRDLRRGWDQTYTELAHEKGMLLDRWCTAEKVTEDFGRFRELVLIEEFKGCVPEEIRMYLNERKNQSISEMARVADEYVLTHKTRFPSPKSYPRDRRNGRESPPAEAEIPPGASRRSEDNRQETWRSPGLTCFNCGKVGHIAVNCLAPRREPERERAATSIGCAVVIRKWTSGPQVDGVPEGRETFTSKGTVSLREGDPPIPVRIWRDTGAELSLISRNVLKFGPRVGEVALRGIGNQTEVVPLHRVLLDCELVSGPVELGVLPELPGEGVDLLLGNDLAGGKVGTAPIVEAPPMEPPSYPTCADARSLSRAAAGTARSLKLAQPFLPTLRHEGSKGGKTEGGKEIATPLMKRKVLEVGNKNEKRIKLLQCPKLDVVDLSGLAGLLEGVENSNGVPDNEMRAVVDEKGTLNLKKSARLADGVESTPEVSCPESNWEDQGNLEFEKGTGIESLEEANALFESVHDGDARGPEPSHRAQKSLRYLTQLDKTVVLLEQIDLVRKKKLKSRWMPAHRVQADLECKGAPHAIVIQESAARKPRFKCGQGERFAPKHISLYGLGRRANYLRGCGVKRIALVGRKGGRVPCQIPRSPHGGTHREKAMGNRNAICKQQHRLYGFAPKPVENKDNPSGDLPVKYHDRND